MGLRQLAETVRPIDDHESPGALPLSGYVCGCCASLLPVGATACPHCHIKATDSTPRPHHPAGVDLRTTSTPSAPTVVDDAVAAGRTRDIRRNWLRRP